jgi:CRISPR-associated endonuclease/helicase Cas3
LVPEVLSGPAARPEQEGTDTLSPLELAWCSSTQAQRVPRTSTTDNPDFDPGIAIDNWIDAVRHAAGSKMQAVLRALAPVGARARFRRLEIAGGRFALVGKRRVDPKVYLRLPEDVAGEILTEDDDSGSFTGVELTLRRHLSDVKEQVRKFAQHLGTSEEIAEDLALAAWLHDVGKADRRFQQILVGGSEVRLALQREPLAKSSGEARDFASRDRARQRARYPRGYRHELLSVAMLESSPGALDAAHDRDLVLHLVGSHHGWCRPFAPAIDPGPHLDVELTLGGLLLRADAAHGLARLDSGVADRFFDLVERYGWWGLAWLEAIVRLADHRASEAARSAVVDESEALASQREAV